MEFWLTFGTGIAVGIALKSGAGARAFDAIERGLDFLDHVLTDPDTRVERSVKKHPATTSSTRPTVFIHEPGRERRPVRR